MDNLEQKFREIFEEHGVDAGIAEAFILDWKKSNPPLEETEASIPELETALLGLSPASWRERAALQARIISTKLEKGY